jgi:hypothetical protein
MNIEGLGCASGSISQRHGSTDPDPDPDPHQNAMDPQHWSGSGRGGWKTPEPSAASILTQCWRISFWRGPGSIRQHTLSLVSVLGVYKDTVLAHKLLAGARLHQATHALIGLCAGGYKDTVLAHKLSAGARLH